MKPPINERGSRFVRALRAWSQEPPRRSAREAADRFRIDAAEAGSRFRARGVPSPARRLAWTAVGLGALVALWATVRVPVESPEAPRSAVDATVRAATSDPDTVVVHELSSGTRVYLFLPSPTAR